MTAELTCFFFLYWWVPVYVPLSFYDAGSHYVTLASLELSV